MKKFLLCILFFIISVLVTGCEVDDEVRNELFESLQKQEIIEEDLDFITSFTSKNIGLFISSKTYDLYKDDDDNIIGIYYFSCSGNNYCNSDYKIEIYDIEVEDEELIEIDEDDLGGYEHYYIMDDKYYENINYDLTLKDEYFVTEHKKFFFFKYYKIDTED